tara:strand:+ start:2688 stop:3182 length:495 start_codon:yes stop_codon:yes gene_type:complete
MLLRNLNNTDASAASWEDLAYGAPTIIGFAELCRQRISSPLSHIAAEFDLNHELSMEAKTILAAAADRGTIDIRANQDSFNSAERFLAVCVEYELEKRLLFLQKENPEQTVKFLEGFRQLCLHGLVLHHLQRDFSLSASGFVFAGSLNKDDYAASLSFASEIDH